MTLATFGNKKENWIWSIIRGFLRESLGRIAIICVWTFSLAYLLGFPPQNLSVQILFVAAFLFLAYGLWGYSSQTVSEIWLLLSITTLYRAIESRIATRKSPTKTTMLGKLDSARSNMDVFLSRSSSQFSPITDLVTDKLKQSVDCAFYSIGLLAFSEKPEYYSASEQRQAEIEAEIEEAQRTEDSWIEEASIAAQEAAEDEFTGSITYFDIIHVRMLIEYLGNRIFKKSGFHPFWAFKYPINVIDYLNFFEHWNTLILSSRNGAEFAKKARQEVKDFYNENRRRLGIRTERIWSLASSLIVAIIVAILSILLSFLFGRV